MVETVKQKADKAAQHLTLALYKEIIADASFLNWSWKERGNCVKAVTKGFEMPNGEFLKFSPMAWFPMEENVVSADIAWICESCPVRLECLSSAIMLNEVKGIWGGYSINIVRRMRRRIITALRNKARR